MIVYTGGNRFNYSLPYFSLTLNYFSELGRTKTFLGEPNLAPRILFSLALIFGGLGMISYFSQFPYFFRKEKKLYRLTIIGSILGFLSGIFCIIITTIPVDIHQASHRVCTYIMGGLEVPLLVLYAVVIFKEKEFPNAYAWIFLSYFVVLLSYITMGLVLGFDNELIKESAKIVGQKIVIFLQIIITAIQAFGLRKLLLAPIFSETTSVD